MKPLASVPGKERENPFPANVCIRKLYEDLGVNALAASLDVTPDAVLITAASILAAIAGPGAELQAPWGMEKIAPVNVLLRGGEPGSSRLLECLSAVPRRLQSDLLLNMSTYRTEALDFLTRGTEIGTKPGSVDWEARQATLRRNMSALTFDAASGDFGVNPVLFRREAISHPQFLMGLGAARSLINEVEDCHLRSSLAFLKRLGHDESEAALKPRLKELSGLLDGMTLPWDRERGIDLPVRLHVIAALPDTDLSNMTGLEGKFLRLSTVGPVQPLRGRRDAAYFFSLFQSVAEQLLHVRRSGAPGGVRFRSPESRDLFHENLWAYRHGHTGTDSAGHEQNLPQLLYWSLRMLSGSGGGTVAEDERRLISAVFGIARRAGESHLRSRSASLNHSETTAAWELSQAVVERILDFESQGKPAPTFREIVRRFSNQERSRFEPVVGMLVELGVLVLEGKRYSSGEVDLLEVEEGWNMAFREFLGNRR
jgi:hypothetical protein